jgi:hypothetical protein
MRELLFDPLAWLRVGTASRRAMYRYINALDCQRRQLRPRATLARAFRAWQRRRYVARLRRESDLAQPLLV